MPIEESWLSLTDRQGYLRLYGRESLSSLHHQSLIARRVQHFRIEATTCIEFSPTNFQQMAGLVLYYNTGHWFYLCIMGAEDGISKYLQLTICDNFDMQEQLEWPLNLEDSEMIYLRVEVDDAEAQFYFASETQKWQKLGPVLDASILSDDYVREGGARYRAAFTGMFVGICCQDLTGQRLHADFNWFDYKELL